MRTKMPNIDRAIMIARKEMKARLAEYRMYKTMCRITTVSANWPIYMKECKKLKKELGILANWLHFLLWLADYTKVKVSKKDHKIVDLIALLPNSGKAKLPGLLNNQVY